ncbi:MAG: hypothetical protein Q4A84_03210 [Neisseria sp.]|uniref:hypothetical protein n=1 Tax=Neisseria sp. TaxID=192066 RepID=UPI0026DB6148|nr:hypothetical protein [Neisseria sp.]MDO4640699.1 hypothetical protein [Neisseria sp.]
MRKPFSLLFFCTVFLAGCSAPKAPDFPNSWKPLNDLPEESVAIPLIKPHVYEVVQLDTTVKGLLERWAEEANMPLVYDNTYDFTLFKRVKEIKQQSLQNALSELTEMYSDKGMVFYIEDGVIMAYKKMGVAVKTKGKSKVDKR